MSGPSLTVAVTGVGGFVGGAAVAELESRGHRVVRLARRPIDGRPEALLWDLREDYSGGEPLPKVDAIAHCAASLATSDVSGELRRVNVEGTRRILEAWPGVPFVFVSSASVYPPSRVAAGGKPLAEADVTGEGLHDDYSRSKLEAEEMLVEEAGHEGRSVTILRASIIYGPGDRTILPRIRRLRLGGWALVPGGTGTWSMTPVGLLSRAIRASVERPSKGVRVLNVAEAPPERVRDLFRRLLEEDAGRRVRVIPLPRWLMWIAGTVVESWCRLFRVSKAPMVTRSAAAYISEERILDLEALRGFLKGGSGESPTESQNVRT